jgi:hypothetical protein
VGGYLHTAIKPDPPSPGYGATDWQATPCLIFGFQKSFNFPLNPHFCDQSLLTSHQLSVMFTMDL